MQTSFEEKFDEPVVYANALNLPGIRTLLEKKQRELPELQGKNKRQRRGSRSSKGGEGKLCLK